MMLLSYTIVDFDFYYNNGAVNMQICTLLTRIQCKVSDTQVTVKACGPLVLYAQTLKSQFRAVFKSISLNRMTPNTDTMLRNDVLHELKLSGRSSKFVKRV